MKDWYVGQRVVCIGDFAWLARIHSLIVPIIGTVYTISSIECREDEIGFHLAEIKNAQRLLTSGEIGEPIWACKDFKPLDEERLDCFCKHLTKIPSKQTEDP